MTTTHRYNSEKRPPSLKPFSGLRISTRWVWPTIALLLWLGLVASCNTSLMRNDLEAILDRGELRLVTRNNAVCYYEGRHGPTGFEYELAKSFADYLGVRLRTIVLEDEAEMVSMLHKGKADIIAPGFAFGRQSARLLALGPGYLDVEQKVVGRRGGPEIKAPADLVDKSIWVSANSARLEILKKIKAGTPGLAWMALKDYTAEELLQMVWNRSLQFTVVASNTIAVNRRIYPELSVYLTIGDHQQLRWAMHPQSHHFQKIVRQWFAMSTTAEFISGLAQHYYSHLENFDYVDLVRYRRRIFKRLPKYKPYFIEAAKKYGLDWQMVAAQAYQESHWNPRARSFTGVRGIMMLTLQTAKDMGIKNRLSPKDSIQAGTRYLARLHRRIGDDIDEPDRTLMALAAYNIGFGHLKDARVLAARLDKPADTWYGVREVLPLLQQKKYYRSLAHGYARGSEAVEYVDRIRTYHKVLLSALHPDNWLHLGS